MSGGLGRSVQKCLRQGCCRQLFDGHSARDIKMLAVEIKWPTATQIAVGHLMADINEWYVSE
jgi:hypothetical protein